MTPVAWNGAPVTGDIMTTIEVRALVKQQKQAERLQKLVYRGAILTNEKV